MSDDIGQSVRDRLAATAQVTALCKATRIFADIVEQDDHDQFEPAIVVFVPNKTAYEDLNSADRCFAATVQVHAYGRDRREANALAKAIRDSALAADLSGSLHGMDWREVSLVDGPAEVVEPPPEGSARWRKVTTQTFSIWANPA